VIEHELLSGYTIAAATLLSALAIALAWSVRPWRYWLNEPERRAVWIGSLVMLGAVWSLNAQFVPGMSQRFLIITAATLLHGWALTILGAALVLAALSALGIADWASLGPNLLCMAAVPAALSGRLHELVFRHLPHNYFVYIFVSAFLGSALAWNAAELTRWLLLKTSGQAPLTPRFAEDYLALLPLMSFGEAFINGLLVAAAVVFRPRWVMSFDERSYLSRL
jgi:uncharacterized membrane protein